MLSVYEGVRLVKAMACVDKGISKEAYFFIFLHRIKGRLIQGTVKEE